MPNPKKKPNRRRREGPVTRQEVGDLASTVLEMVVEAGPRLFDIVVQQTPKAKHAYRLAKQIARKLRNA